MIDQNQFGISDKYFVKTLDMQWGPYVLDRRWTLGRVKQEKQANKMTRS